MKNNSFRLVFVLLDIYNATRDESGKAPITGRVKWAVQPPPSAGPFSVLQSNSESDPSPAQPPDQKSHAY